MSTTIQKKYNKTEVDTLLADKADAADLADYLPLAGGTMTGTLKTTPSEAIHVKGTFDSTVTPTGSIYSPNMRFKDSQDNDVGVFQGFARANGTVGLQINGRRRISGSYVNNNLSLGVRSDGTQFVELDQAAWLTALGLNTVDITSSISYNETVGTWTKVTVKAGVVYINFQGEGKARSANDVLMTIPEGYRPANVVACPFTYASANVYGTVSVNTNGQVVVRNISDSTSSARLIFNISYTL